MIFDCLQMSTFGIDNIENILNWADLWARLGPDASPFFSPSYYRVFGTLIEGVPECFWMFKDEGNYLFYPWLRMSINCLGYELDEEYYDISGAYGYNGPHGFVTDKQFLHNYNRELQSYLESNNIVTEFVRYCPISNNRRFHTYTEQIDMLDNVYIDLSKGLDQVWNESFEYRVRKAVRKGESYGLRTKILATDDITQADIDSFFQIYTSTMRRNNADMFYFFSLEFFKALVKNMKGMLLLATTYLEEKAVSTELVLTSGKLAYAFLGGTLDEYFQHKANTFQRWELLKYLQPRGFEKYSMGGSNKRGDSIYSFKKSFAKNCENPFFIGTRVHLPEVYAQIQQQWRSLFSQVAEQNSNRLQGYRIQS